LFSTDYIGLIAGLLVTGSLVPQIMRVFRLKSAREISVLYTTLLLAGTALWLTYGVMLGLKPIIFWNSIGLVLTMTLLGAKMKYGK
jgi:MtN3 and saliva related transmembrane protein